MAPSWPRPALQHAHANRLGDERRRVSKELRVWREDAIRMTHAAAPIKFVAVNRRADLTESLGSSTFLCCGSVYLQLWLGELNLTYLELFDGYEMHTIDSDDSKAVQMDRQSDELTVRGPVNFVTMR
ncbi:uncharacterized protein F5147DRAFT_763049 [Suillus discolor]|uniref:Uncharacterized protein n=1 Tax=Suillus discolor TaxID=1912936 RepID=A0A9P7JQP1_9AGAM|nr:uncharacterized protein F5147DRAFT_763049 [Suillus discolor]KAG2099592.1 hypothetical protein F5147DRAFT_763049 [Suillus discolor]